MHTAEIDRFVHAVDACGGDLASATVQDAFYPIDLDFDAVVDQSSDPFSASYFDQQVALYREIAARALDQSSGELHDDDLRPLLTAANPTGVANAAMLAESMRALTTMLSLSTLGAAPRILDLGAGHGLSSEIYAYAGCKVHAIDIDPALGDLSRRRSSARNLDITRDEMNFDDLGGVPDSAYDAAFFFQSFHHCLRPWDLVEQLKSKIVPDGIIGFVGEPVQENWWKNWGIRLDPESIYVARKRGWFENGWSHRFIRQCFERNGLTLAFFTGGLGDGAIGIAAASAEKLEAVRVQARALGLSEIYRVDEFAIPNDLFLTHSGKPTTLIDRPAFTQVPDRKGALIYGPYVDLEPGLYQVTVIAQRSAPRPGLSLPVLTLDIRSEGVSAPLFKRRHFGSFSDPTLICHRFEVRTLARRVETRIFVAGENWTATLPVIQKIG
ncbi:class I SAM-dependent methyltransferase [Sphingomonas sp. PB2P12]